MVSSRPLDELGFEPLNSFRARPDDRFQRPDAIGTIHWPDATRAGETSELSGIAAEGRPNDAEGVLHSAGFHQNRDPMERLRFPFSGFTGRNW